MFGLLKNKLKEWAKNVKDKLKPEEKIDGIIEEKKEKIEEPVKDTKKEKEIKEKPEKKKGKKKKEKETKKEEKIEEKKSFFEKIFGKNKEEKKEEEKIKEIKELKEKVKKELKEEEKEIKKLEKEKERFAKETDLLKIEPEIKPIEEPEIKEEEKEIKKLEKEKEEKKSFFEKLKSTFTYKITDKDFNEIFNDLEMLLLENNTALEVVEEIKNILSKKLINKEIKKENLEKTIFNELKEALKELIIEPFDLLIEIKNKKEKDPYVILFFGINGTGKTTTIAKIAYLLKNNNLSVVLAAADTFRAASIEQLQEHANKLNIPLIKHNYQADPAAVGFDAIKYAKNHNIDVVLIDTAGRMHTKNNLIAEMEKICRVTKPNLKIFVAESIAGNDAIEQSKKFNEAIGIDGSILSKADIDEKGGTIISISYVTKKPIFYLGTGQSYEDLKLFNKQEFIESLGL
ncbi:MAG: signal recognition particle-docking protein FtsY [Candidatus Pacearchaeota archaeon]